LSIFGKYSATLLSLPFMLVIGLFFVLPLLLVVMVSFWDYNSYSIIPDFIFTNYEDIFYGCIRGLPDLCTAFATYLSTIKFVFITWLVTLIVGFLVALFLAFCVRSLPMQVALFLLCTIPFWTSNVIRMISWIPLLGRNGLVNTGLMDVGLIQSPFEWLLYSEFAVIVAFVHLYTLFMVVPIFNSMMRIDRSLLEAAYDAGASTWQTLANVVIPLCRPGIIIGSIFVVTIVMGDFITIGVMGGQQIASVGKIINVEMQYLQFPAAAANAVILIFTTLMIIFGMTRIVDVRKEL
jgi:putative spermidine/putrescine transport system permease protein